MGWLAFSVLVHAAAALGLLALPAFEKPPPEPLPIRVFLDRSADAPGHAPSRPVAAAAPPSPEAARRPSPRRPERRAAAPSPPAAERQAPRIPAAEAAAGTPPPTPTGVDAGAAPADVAAVSAPADVASAPAGAAGGDGTEHASLGAARHSPGAGHGAAADPEAELRAFIDLVRRRIDAEKRYPSLARSRRVEGTVVALIHLGREGALDAIEILESPSGLLTEPTRRAILAAGPFPPPPGGLRRIRVPIRYRLD